MNFGITSNAGLNCSSKICDPGCAINFLYVSVSSVKILGESKKIIHSKYMVEKEMATHSSILAWKNPWTEESGGLKSMGLHD